MLALRYGLPAAIFAAGVVLLLAFPGSTGIEGFAMCTGAALSVLFLNWLFRLGAAGDSERESEDAAREHMARTGRWPDE